MSDIKWMDLKEFRDSGLLQECNRQFFHPLGIALALGIDDSDNWVVAGFQDFRDDPEGMAYLQEDLNKDKALRVGFEQAKRYATRQEKLGFDIQPISP